MNLEHESTSISGETPDHIPGFFGALRSRYQVFIGNYRDPSSPASSGEQARFGQKLISSIILFILVITILIVFGVGLSWFNISSQIDNDAQANPPATKSAGAEAPAALPSPQAQPAGPAGHAEVRPQSEPGKKAEGK